MPKKNAKSKRPDAERAAVHYVMDFLGCIESCRAVRTQWQRQDLFGADVMGKFSDGSKVFVQATAGQNSAVTARRRKLETVWHITDLVQIAQLVQTEDPASGRRKLWFFRIHDYTVVTVDPCERAWITIDKAVPVPREWFKSWKGEQL